MSPYKARALFAIFAVAIVATACSTDNIFIKTQITDPQMWTTDKPAIFEFTPLTDKTNDIQLIIRHNEEFESQSVTLAVKTTLPNKTYFVDTVTIPLCNPDGSWQGTKRSSFRDLTTPYRSNIKFTCDKNKKITVSITPIENTQNIEFVGVNISNAEAIYK